MPADILAGLTEIANRALWLAVAWHVVLGVALIGLVRGWRPGGRTARVLIALPLLSVAALAAIFKNPFNALMFGAGAVSLIVIGLRGVDTHVRTGPAWAYWIGVASVTFGWVYPHFLDAQPIALLVAAPFGLVPCPTLAVAIGLALLGGGLRARVWTLVLAAFGLFYGVFGVFRLGVILDMGLVLASVALVVAALRMERKSHTPAHVW